MKLLIVGGAGYVASIIRPALEAAHDCRYLDLDPVSGAEERTFVGDLNDRALLDRAVPDVDVLVWLAMGRSTEMENGEHEVEAAFDVNVRGFYRVLDTAHRQGVCRFVFASSMSVYKVQDMQAGHRVDENCPIRAWDPYGLSKRLGEYLGEALVQHDPSVTFVSLRLMFPKHDSEWDGEPTKSRSKYFPTGPEDTRRLFCAAIDRSEPGFANIQATGDRSGTMFSYDRAMELLGWKPQGA